MKKLPIGIQTLREIRTKGHAYVDKTALVARLAEEGKYYFLSRPRRFGKSLLVDTLAEAFQGSRELFEGLYLEEHWNWQRRHPVVRLDLSSGVIHDPAVLDGYTPDSGERQRTERAVLDALEGDDPQALREALFAFFASIPHDWSVQGGTYAAGGQDARSGDRNNRLADYEGYYCSVVYCYFAGLGVDVRAEEPSHRGKVDLCIRYRGRIWLLEFKLSEHGGGAALAQIEARGYHHRFQGQAVTLIGIDFDRQTRNISGFEWKRVAV